MLLCDEFLLFWEHFVMKDSNISYPLGIVSVWTVSMFNSGVTAALVYMRIIHTVHYKVFTAAFTAFSGCCHLLFTDTSGVILLVLLVCSTTPHLRGSIGCPVHLINDSRNTAITSTPPAKTILN